jgi:hypothetical protein
MTAEEQRESIHEIAKRFADEPDIAKAEVREIMRAQAKADYLNFISILDDLGVEGARKVQGQLSAALTMRAAYALSDEFLLKPERMPKNPQGGDYLEVVKKK